LNGGAPWPITFKKKKGAKRGRGSGKNPLIVVLREGRACLKRCCDDQTLPPNDDLRELARTDFANPHQADDLSREKGLNGRLGAQSDDLREGSDGGGGSRSAPSILFILQSVCSFVCSCSWGFLISVRRSIDLKMGQTRMLGRFGSLHHQVMSWRNRVFVVVTESSWLEIFFLPLLTG